MVSEGSDQVDEASSDSSPGRELEAGTSDERIFPRSDALSWMKSLGNTRDAGELLARLESANRDFFNPYF